MVPVRKAAEYCMQEARSAYQIRAGMKDAAARIDRLQYLGYACEESDLV
jgi:hypothetical protein